MLVPEEESDESSTEIDIVLRESLQQVVEDQKLRAREEKLVQTALRRSFQEERCKPRRRQKKNGLGHLTETWMCFVYEFESLKPPLRNQIEEFLELEEQKTLHRCILWMRPHVPGKEHCNFWIHCHDAAAGSDWLPHALMSELTEEQELSSPCRNPELDQFWQWSCLRWIDDAKKEVLVNRVRVISIPTKKPACVAFGLPMHA